MNGLLVTRKNMNSFIVTNSNSLSTIIITNITLTGEPTP